MIYRYMDPSTDFAIDNDQNYIFFSASTKKYIVLKKNHQLEFLINMFSAGDYFHNYREHLKRMDEDFKYYDKLLNMLIKKSIFQYDIVEDETLPPSIYLPDLFYDHRYGYQNKYFRDRYFDDDPLFNPTTKVLKNKTITIVGLGAVGSFIAVMCAAIGVGKIVLIDGDLVEESNLTRQLFFKERDVKSNYKVHSLMNYISQFNSKVDVIGINKYITGNLDESIYFKDSDLVLQSADKPTGYIDRFVDKLSVIANVSRVYVHNGSIGPFISRNDIFSYGKFEEYLDIESKCLYSKSLENISSDSKTHYPTIVHGILTIVNILFDNILTFLMTEKMDFLHHKVYYLDNKESVDYISILEELKRIKKG